MGLTGSTYGLMARAARLLPPETAHNAAIRFLKTVPSAASENAPSPFAQTLCGLTFPNPVGLAAGFDKHAEVPDAVLCLGFGFVEVGTVTPKPQPGNPQPRLFRLPEAQALINRFGFNSEGAEIAAERLRRRKDRGGNGLVGINIGANKTSEDRIADYATGIRTFAGLADYFTVNISSPNTPGLRDLQGADDLKRLLAAVTDARAKAGADAMPIFLKVAPDLDTLGVETIATVTREHGLDGLIVSNTTLSRQGVGGPVADEAGGLSGAPLFDRATAVLARFRQAVGTDMVLIGAGGIATADQVAEKIAAGADLVQLYSALVYHGFGLAARINAELPDAIRTRGGNTIRAVRDSRTDFWGARFETFAAG